MTVYEPWDAARGAEIIAEHMHLEGATLAILHALQEAFGYVPEPAIPSLPRSSICGSPRHCRSHQEILGLADARGDICPLEAGGAGLDPNVRDAIATLKTASEQVKQ